MSEAHLWDRKISPKFFISRIFSISRMEYMNRGLAAVDEILM